MLGTHVVITLRTVAPHDSALIYSFLTIAARMDESGEPVQKALSDPALIKYWKNWGLPTDLGIVAESAELNYPVGCAWLRLFTGEEPGHGHVSDDIPELAFGVIKSLRNQGIGTLLLERLIADCRTQYPGISLSVRQDNLAVRIYERAGFRQHGDVFTNRVGTSSMTMLLRFS
ncbi:MAG: GNAT family N-acetyltransferase [Acidobacteria bacterium]|nr:GNAT family N-acetyltransferase [Acidobacteriota bacterium]MDA1235647.1 GNAT family N-acetyltransferase [Acidobacteriota bacterium]